MIQLMIFYAATEILQYPKPSTEYPIKTQINKIQIDKNFVLKIKQYHDPNFYWCPEEGLFTKNTINKRKGIEPKHREKKQFLVYDINGNFINIYNSIKDIIKEYPEYKDSGIRNSIKNNKNYKNYYFKQIISGNSYDTKINTAPALCEIDNIMFYKQSEIAKYTGVSRQAVSDCLKRKGGIIGGKKVNWF